MANSYECYSQANTYKWQAEQDAEVWIKKALLLYIVTRFKVSSQWERCAR